MKFYSILLLPVLLLATSTASSQPEESCTPPPKNMIGWWTGDGHANDIVNGHNGRLVAGATTLVPGKVASGFDLTHKKQKDFVQIKSSAFDFSFTNSFTIDAWVKAKKSQHEGSVGIVSKAKGNRGEGRYALQLYTKNGVSKADFFTSESHGADNDNLVGRSKINDGQWHLLAVTYDASTQKKRLFVDGIEEASSQLNLQTDNFFSTGELVFGKHSTGADAGDIKSNYNGYLDEVEIFDRALMSKEIKRIYKAGQFGKCKSKYIKEQ